MPDFRSLISRMADELDQYRQLLLDDRSVTHRLADEARAALAEPEPEEEVLARVAFKDQEINFPSDLVLRQYCDDWFNSDPEREEVDPVELCRGAIKLFADWVNNTSRSNFDD